MKIQQEHICEREQNGYDGVLLEPAEGGNLGPFDAMLAATQDPPPTIAQGPAQSVPPSSATGKPLRLAESLPVIPPVILPESLTTNLVDSIAESPAQPLGEVLDGSSEDSDLLLDLAQTVGLLPDEALPATPPEAAATAPAEVVVAAAQPPQNPLPSGGPAPVSAQHGKNAPRASAQLRSPLPAPILPTEMEAQAVDGAPAAVISAESLLAANPADEDEEAPAPQEIDLAALQQLAAEAAPLWEPGTAPKQVAPRSAQEEPTLAGAAASSERPQRAHAPSNLTALANQRGSQVVVLQAGQERPSLPLQPAGAQPAATEELEAARGEQSQSQSSTPSPFPTPPPTAQLNPLTEGGIPTNASPVTLPSLEGFKTFEPGQLPEVGSEDLMGAPQPTAAPQQQAQLAPESLVLPPALEQTPALAELEAFAAHFYDPQTLPGVATLLPGLQPSGASEAPSYAAAERSAQDLLEQLSAEGRMLQGSGETELGRDGGISWQAQGARAYERQELAAQPLEAQPLAVTSLPPSKDAATEQPEGITAPQGDAVEPSVAATRVDAGAQGLPVAGSGAAQASEVSQLSALSPASSRELSAPQTLSTGQSQRPVVTAQALPEFMVARYGTGAQRFECHIAPPDLGPLQCKFEMKGAEIFVQLTVSSDAAAQLLGERGQQQHITQAFEDAGLNLGGLDINVANDNASDAQEQPWRSEEQTQSPGAPPTQQRQRPQAEARPRPSPSSERTLDLIA